MQYSFDFFGDPNSNPDRRSMNLGSDIGGGMEALGDRIQYRLEMCTEILGSESGDFMVEFSLWPMTGAGGDRPRPSSSGSRTSSMNYCGGEVRREEYSKDFPPRLLTTLNSYGRPRFILNKVSCDDGRLLIVMERDERPRLERVWMRDSDDVVYVLREKLLPYDSDEQEQHGDQDEVKDHENKEEA